MFGIGAGEFILIVIVGLIVFGPSKLPEFGRSVGKLLREFRKAQAALSSTLNDLDTNSTSTSNSTTNSTSNSTTNSTSNSTTNSTSNSTTNSTSNSTTNSNTNSTASSSSSATTSASPNPVNSASANSTPAPAVLSSQPNNQLDQTKQITSSDVQNFEHAINFTKTSSSSTSVNSDSTSATSDSTSATTSADSTPPQTSSSTSEPPKSFTTQQLTDIINSNPVKVTNNPVKADIDNEPLLNKEATAK